MTNEHHHQLQQIGVSLDAKFNLKPTILIFTTKFAQKGIPYKAGQMNITNEFNIFEIV